MKDQFSSAFHGWANLWASRLGRALGLSRPPNAPRNFSPCAHSSCRFCSHPAPQDSGPTTAARSIGAWPVGIATVFASSIEVWESRRHSRAPLPSKPAAPPARWQSKITDDFEA